MKFIRSFKRGGLKGLTCIIIIVAIICLITLPVHATTSFSVAASDNIEITAISENTALVNDGDTISKITVSGSKIEVVNEGDSSDNLTLTISGNQIHSSATGETVTFTEDEVNALTN